MPLLRLPAHSASGRSWRKQQKLSRALILIVLSIGSVIMVLPFVWLVLTSFDWSARLNIPFPPRFWPKTPSVRTYEAAMNNIDLFRYIWNTSVVAVGVILISLLSALLSGYALSKIRFRGAQLILVLALSTMMIPFEMTMIPQYMIFARLNLLDSYWVFFLPALNYAFGTFMAKQFVDQLPGSLREAGKMDGAHELSIFFRIYVPLCGPVIATMIILQFLAVWNDLMWPMLALNSTDKYLIQLGLAMFSYNNGENQMPSIIMAATTVSLLPVFVLYMFLQRYIVEGIALTGIKQ
ncbi:carbohydrate ABC transporter permease [Paenibacillus terreus]|uniref:Carbohydrate ABC transporter permease n=1 Tax=Paenibacillus terreus TaxID=1387834 RepID=A0ABV5B5P0_9BACL